MQAYRKGISLVGIEKAIALVSNGANGLTDLRFANMEALEEIYRVLIPGGVFGMIWNIEDCSQTLPTRLLVACIRAYKCLR